MVEKSEVKRLTGALHGWDYIVECEEKRVLHGSADIAVTEYIRIDQGVYSVNSPVIDTPLQIREGACGTPLIHIGNQTY